MVIEGSLAFGCNSDADFIARHHNLMDISGVLGHATIVAREYYCLRLAAKGAATRIINTGGRIRFNGDTGLVNILERKL